MAKKTKGSVQTTAQSKQASGDKPKASTEQVLKELQGKATAHTMHSGQAAYYEHKLKVEKKLEEQLSKA